MFEGLKIKIIFLGFTLLLVTIVFFGYQTIFFPGEDVDMNLEYREGVVIIEGREFLIQVADTIPTRVQGLSGRETLAPFDGLLIVFGRSSKDHRIWMKDMEFSLDLIWLSEDGEVVDLDRSLSPDTYPESFRPEREAYSVLEVVSGSVQEWGVEVGDRFEILY